MKASAIGPVPARAAMRMSRAKPMMRLAMVQPPTVTMPLNIYSSRIGRVSRAAAAPSTVRSPASRAATARQIGRSTVPARASSAGGGGDAFDDAGRVGQGFGQGAAAAEGDAAAIVAAGRAGAGQQQIAQAGQAGDRFGPAAEGGHAARQLGQAARDQGGAGVLAEPGAGDDPGGDGDDVLGGAAELGAERVVIAVEAVIGGGEEADDGGA